MYNHKLIWCCEENVEGTLMTYKKGSALFWEDQKGSI